MGRQKQDKWKAEGMQEERDAHEHTFFRTTFPRNTNRAFQKPFCCVFLPISEITVKIMANVFVAL